LNQVKRGRGRPLGFRLSEESKRAISESKKGQKHSEATKEKISRTLMAYFRMLYPFSKELYDDYKDLIDNDAEVRLWYEANIHLLDDSSTVLTEKSLNAKRQRELSIELNMDMSNNININSFTNNPEKMCELKLLCKSKGIDYKKILVLLEDLEK